MKILEIIPTQLQGSIPIPPSKSLCHRAIIAGALAKGESHIHNIVLSDDISATMEAVQALGADVTYSKNLATVSGIKESPSSDVTIHCKESGSTLRFIIPLGLLTDRSITYTGSGNLSTRPLGPYLDIFKNQGIQYSSSSLPMEVSGLLQPGNFELMGNISSQFITGLLFALPLLNGDSSITIKEPIESKAYIDLTIDVLHHFGIQIQYYDKNRLFIKGSQQYLPTSYPVEGDFSQAAFWIAAGILGGEVCSKGMNLNSRQGDKALLEILQKCGAQLELQEDAIIAKPSRLKGFQVDVSQYPDLAPILAVIASLSEGVSKITGASRLRIKECDRLHAIAAELNKLGAEVIEEEDSLVIFGRERLAGGTVDSWGDHRIAMALAIASIRCDAPVLLTNPDVVAKSYPTFFQDFTILGGVYHERNLG